ncbi:3-isopropylmalate dehydratase large subunit [candidate division KSB3 bacterium]|uniref:3-isopropylmalate dehydratase large subunit n=1 Tax=candidate division KSB3 bacterium TaxID=2044937 RepID=A0A2G6E843_9BACT|nr:MAG: 3-isopropylmalate dehydratase large subunit [candidate division KSB3 bacterium]PIE30564.1 MAG: 3-isopropylmalate dehydratase large subunit [candidate division KSB3 bacterium]
MGQTIVEKIISRQVGCDVYAGEKIERLPITKLFFNDVIGPPAIKGFLENFSDLFKKYGKPSQVWDPRRLFFIPDHSVPAFSVSVAEGIDLMETFSRERGIQVYKEGDGIEHVVLMEDGQIVPWDIVLGTDSHTDTNGAMGALAFGVGTTDGFYAMATGHLYDFVVPESIRFELVGSLAKGVYSKDIILHIIGKMGAGGCSKRVAEFTGEGLRSLNMDARTTICNMAVEMSARSGIMACDEIIAEYLQDRAQWPVEPIDSDPDANYADSMTIDLSTLEPCVAFPHKPANVTTVNNVQTMIEQSQKVDSPDFCAVEDDRITDAFLGACTNGRYEDLKAGAEVLQGRNVHPDVNLIVIPASRKVYERAMDEGILQVFVKAGANVESSNCGPCFGSHMGVISRDARMISSSNRNYKGRMGSGDGRIFLASPATVIASAIEGKIADPRKFL